MGSVAEVNKVLKFILTMRPKKENIVNVPDPQERFLRTRREKALFKATHKKTSHRGGHFGTHAGTENLLVVRTIECEIIVREHNLHQIRESIELRGSEGLEKE